MAPIVNEPDDNLKAESHRSALESVLAVFGKEVVHCLFLVGDNCSVNKKLARLMNVPLVGLHENAVGDSFDKSTQEERLHCT
ncbi:hypothetical protein GQ600_8694 [Phytophthora cactorum]|nr:hypothetical protein GQ600_8694 [Phytophthora cactorum]